MSEIRMVTNAAHTPTRWQVAVWEALRNLEQDRDGTDRKFSAREVAAELVGTQTAHSVRRILEKLHRYGYVRRWAHAGYQGSHLYQVIRAEPDA